MVCRILGRLTLRAEEVNVSCSKEAAEQRPDEDLWANGIDASSTSKHHDPGREPFARGTKTAGNVSILQRCNLRSIYPASSKPSKSKDDFVKYDDCCGCPIRPSAGHTGRKSCENNVNEHTDTAAKSRPIEEEAQSVRVLNVKRT